MDNVENVIILSPNVPTLRADHAKTKDYCMTRFFGHGQSILQVFETPITLHMVESVKCHLLSTLLDPISWDLAISLIPCEWRDNTSSSKSNNDVESTDKAAGSKKRHVPKAINTETKQLNESCSQKQ